MSKALEMKVSSSLWAAYGDALGFPMELVDRAGVQRRIGLPSIEATVPWRRLVGGRGGSTADFPSGTYSDDTQLRLSTSRAIRDDGQFDVEAFSKIELPVWLSYSLGAGRGSKAAAASLTQRNNAWFSNFFDIKETRYLDGGGNGAAMRVQPHVWAASAAKPDLSFLRDVIRNSVCTHGHARGISGAVLHAVFLSIVLREARLPKPAEWRDLGQCLDSVAAIVEADPELGTFWLPTWNERCNVPFHRAMKKARDEWTVDVDKAVFLLDRTNPDAYERIVTELGGMTAEHRGSGLKAALFSLCLSWLKRGDGVEAAVLSAANLLGSDTDTIASMVGALMGAMHPNELPKGDLQDRGYLIEEATRMHAVSEGHLKPSFPYPDLMTWQPPQTQLESVGSIQGRLALSGMGWIEPQSDAFTSPRGDAKWQWYKLHFGQTILCKRRSEPGELPTAQYPGIVAETAPYKRPATFDGEKARKYRKTTHHENRDLLKDAKQTAQEGQSRPTLDEMTTEAVGSEFNPALIGAHLLSFANSPDGLELAIAYSAVVIKARRARLKSSRPA